MSLDFTRTPPILGKLPVGECPVTRTMEEVFRNGSKVQADQIAEHLCSGCYPCYQEAERIRKEVWPEYELKPSDAFLAICGIAAGLGLHFLVGGKKQG